MITTNYTQNTSVYNIISPINTLYRITNTNYSEKIDNLKIPFTIDVAV